MTSARTVSRGMQHQSNADSTDGHGCQSNEQTHIFRARRAPLAVADVVTLLLALSTASVVFIFVVCRLPALVQ